MTESVAAGQRRVVWGSAGDGDEWVVVFRMDDLPRDSEGPQIVITGIPMSSREEVEGKTAMRSRSASPSAIAPTSSSRSGTRPEMS